MSSNPPMGTNPAPGSIGTIHSIFDSLTSSKISLPFVGSVSAGMVVLGLGVVYFGFIRKRGSKVAIVRV